MMMVYTNVKETGIIFLLLFKRLTITLQAPYLHCTREQPNTSSSANASRTSFSPQFLRFLVALLALLHVVVKDGAEVLPSGLRDEDGVAVVALDLGDRDVAALGVLLAGEEEVLVLDLDVAVLGDVGGLLDLAVVVLLDELLEVVIEVVHALGGDEDLEPRIAAGEGLGNLQEATTGIFLQINVVLLVFLKHDLGLELALGEVVGVDGPHLGVRLDKVLEVSAELSGSGKCHQDLVLATVRADLGDLDEPSPRVLLDVQVEPLGLEDERAGGQVARAVAAAAALVASVVGAGLGSRHAAAISESGALLRNDVGGSVRRVVSTVVDAEVSVVFPFELSFLFV